MPRSRRGKGRKNMTAKYATSQFEEDWQFNKSLAECNRHMLENGIATDITFLVSDEYGDSEVETFSCHKYMLISRSPVFCAMLCGDLAETGEIKVTDVHPEAFRQMLNYIYTADLVLNQDLVAHVINASTKYLLPGLTTKCAEFIKDHLDSENVCTILDQILIFEQTDLNKICLNFIMRETTTTFLESEAFLSMSHGGLSKILDIDTCEVQELDIFKACVKWAEQKCKEEKMEATGINIRKVLGDCINRFRFTNITEFAREVCPTEVFTKDEEHGIICHLADKQSFSAPDGFSCEPRAMPIYSVITSEEIQQGDLQGLDYNIQIYSNNTNDIQVKTLLIGKAFNQSGTQISCFSIKYNGINITGTVSSAQDDKMLRFTCESQFIITPGHSEVRITYKEDEIIRPLENPYQNIQLPYHHTYLGSTSGNVYGVPRSNMILHDGERISLKLSVSIYKFMPLLGLTYKR